MADVTDHDTMLRGCLNRFCAKNPEVTAEVLDELADFVEDQILSEFSFVLTPTDVPTYAEYIDSTHHPEWRKEELRAAARSFDDKPLCPKDYAIKSHGKRETYPSYKHARGINSRCDRFKVYVGRYFRALEHKVFAHPAFIKKIPYKDRAAYIFDMLGDKPGPYFETDYSHFESHFIPEVMDALEMRLYEHAFSQFPDVVNILNGALMGKNKCCFRDFTISILGTRMSGEMCTSLGNGFSNLMLARFVAHRKHGSIIGVVEGDDGLFSSSVPITSDDFRAVGFDIKILSHNDLLRTRFCGMTMSSDLCALTDPGEVFLNFGWSHSVMHLGSEKVRLGLLRAKALSLLYEHPRCPLVTALAKRALALTAGVLPRFGDDWYEHQLHVETLLYEAFTKSQSDLGISDICRHDFYELYNITPMEQRIAEERISQLSLSPISDSFILNLLSISADAQDYYSRFTKLVRRK